MAIPELPTELWLHIGSYLPDDDLKVLHGVNRLFLWMAFTIRYRTVTVKNLLQQSTLKQLRRLQDPFVAQFTTNLTLDVSETLSSKRSPGSASSARLFSVVRNVLSKAALNVSEQPGQQEEDPACYLLSAQLHFRNLTSLELQFWGPALDTNVTNITSELWKNHGARLTKLSLGGPLEEYARILSQQPHLPLLEDLELKFCQESLDEQTLRHCIAPWLNSIGGQLKSFTLLSWASGSLEALFEDLEPFSPKLEKLRIRAPFNQAFLGSGRGLGALLQARSASLTDLEFRLNPLGAVFDPGTEMPLANWMYTNFLEDDRMLPSLQSLEIYPSRLTLGWEATLALLERSVGALKRLTIRDRYLTLEEVTALASVLSKGTGLELLRINVKTPSIEIMDVLAKSVPHLLHLQLYLGNGGHGEPESCFLNMTSAMKNRQYKHWYLQKLEVWQFFQSGYRITLDQLCGGRLPTECFPSLIEGLI